MAESRLSAMDSEYCHWIESGGKVHAPAVFSAG
jgi:hypothetical protein